ncbi:DoxX family protein [Vibrio spartinae]|uniref:Oxidoreductase CatD n=1 Tax=Vibrio spartinae TaxID=1918945 RepID=A0A1N6M0G3_9VIBR|nr:DoxX family protein [Vibrio spartinae]QMV15060.1 Putative oxidoreductase CatD [Vibrio spartinae]SIO92928.1 Putative oxidoreductase CatD [Vibrio spartinae]
MNSLIRKFEAGMNHPDAAKLILRVSFGLMFLLHGIHKIYDGTAFIQGMFVDIGLPGFFAYAVYLGEVIAPIMIVFGLFTRFAATAMIGTSIVVIGLMHRDNFFSLNEYGAWAVEEIGTYLFASITILLLGSGKYALRPD